MQENAVRSALQWNERNTNVVVHGFYDVLAEVRDDIRKGALQSTPQEQKRQTGNMALPHQSCNRHTKTGLIAFGQVSLYTVQRAQIQREKSVLRRSRSDGKAMDSIFSIWR